VADADLEVMAGYLENTLPQLDPVIYHELTDYGWRGLTQQGEVLEVRGSNGHRIDVPGEMTVYVGGMAIGRREVRNDGHVDIDGYLEHFNRVVMHYKANQLDQALVESDAALRAATTLRAKFNRAMILLAAGRWTEGLEQYWHCEQQRPFMRPQVCAALDAGMQPWRGERLSGKRLAVLHAHGFGDTIQMLRYLPALYGMGASVMVDLPFALQRLAPWPTGNTGDYFCPILHLLHFLRASPQNIDARPYIAVNACLADRWQTRLGPKRRRRVGVAWSVGKPSPGDYPREIPLVELIAIFPEAELHSVQIQNADEARRLGVNVHDFADFADCAALMMQMDEIVSVDTAALHLAGAIGHPRVFGLLSHWASWRWVARWYDNVTLCRQARADDWASALAAVHGG
jgi:hypothetical protein